MTTPSVAKLFCAFCGIVWCYLEPTIPFIIIVVIAMLLDIYSAYRLNCRVRKRYGDKAKDGKLKSNDAAKIIPDTGIVVGVIFLAHIVEIICLPQFAPLYLPNYVCAVFCSVQLLSVLENTSTCNNAPWARLAQKFIANKIARHLDCTEEDLLEILKKEKEEEEPFRKE